MADEVEELENLEEEESQDESSEEEVQKKYVNVVLNENDDAETMENYEIIRSVAQDISARDIFTAGVTATLASPEFKERVKRIKSLL